VLAAQSLLMALVAAPSGWLSDRIGTRGLAAGGLLILAVGLAGLASVEGDAAAWQVMIWWAVTGFGTGVFISPNSSALMGQAPQTQQGVASGVMAVARNSGMMLGVAMATVIFQSAGGQTGQQWRVADFDAFRTALLVAAAVGLAGAAASVVRGSSKADIG